MRFIRGASRFGRADKPALRPKTPRKPQQIQPLHRRRRQFVILQPQIGPVLMPHVPHPHPKRQPSEQNRHEPRPTINSRQQYVVQQPHQRDQAKAGNDHPGLRIIGKIGAGKRHLVPRIKCPLVSEHTNRRKQRDLGNAKPAQHVQFKRQRNHKHDHRAPEHHEPVHRTQPQVAAFAFGHLKNPIRFHFRGARKQVSRAD
jgi:hypothetical protein